MSYESPANPSLRWVVAFPFFMAFVGIIALRLELWEGSVPPP